MLLDVLENERCDQAEEGEGLGEDEAEEHVLADQAVGLGLAGDGLDALAEDDADTDAGADGGKAVPDGSDISGDLSESANGCFLC